MAFSAGVAVGSVVGLAAWFAVGTAVWLAAGIAAGSVVWLTAGSAVWIAEFSADGVVSTNLPLSCASAVEWKIMHTQATRLAASKFCFPIARSPARFHPHLNCVASLSCLVMFSPRSLSSCAFASLPGLSLVSLPASARSLSLLCRALHYANIVPLFSLLFRHLPALLLIRSFSLSDWLRSCSSALSPLSPLSPLSQPV